MKFCFRLLPIGALLATIGCSERITPAPKSVDAQNECLRRVSNKAMKAKPGITRAELEQVFTPDAGLSTFERGTYVLPGCPTVKVDVTFTVVPMPTSSHVDERRPFANPADLVS